MARCFRVMLVTLLLAVTLTTLATAQQPPTKKLLLLGQSPDGHPPATHEYLPGLRVLAKCLAGTPQLQISVINADEPWTDGPDLLKDADGAVLFLSEGAKWLHAEPRRLEALAQLASNGGGLSVVHWGMGTREARNIDGFLKLLGGCHGGPDRKYKVLQNVFVEVVDAKHPITTGIADFRVNEEFYYQLKFLDAQRSIKPILKANIDDSLETVAWAWERPDGGRSFGFSGGHYHDNWQRVEYRRLVAQAVLWSLKLPIPEGGLPVEVTPDDLKLQQ
jgi:type 1 glutamine amidotransferase